MKIKYIINRDLLYILCFVMAPFIITLGIGLVKSIDDFLSNLFGYLLIITGGFFVVFLIKIMQKIDEQQGLTEKDLKLLNFFGIYIMTIGIFLFLYLLLLGFDMLDFFVAIGTIFIGWIIYFAEKDKEINVAICHKEK